MGHLRNPGESEADQKGAFPPLLVKQDGTAFSVFQTDRFNLEDLQDADGSAVLIHAAPGQLREHPEALRRGARPGDDGHRRLGRADRLRHRPEVRFRRSGSPSGRSGARRAPGGLGARGGRRRASAGMCDWSGSGAGVKSSARTSSPAASTSARALARVNQRRWVRSKSPCSSCGKRPRKKRAPPGPVRDVRDGEHEDPVWSEQPGNPGHRLLRVREVLEDVAAHHRVVRTRELCADGGVAEVAHHDGEGRPGCRIVVRLDALDRAALLEQQRTEVPGRAADIQHGDARRHRGAQELVRRGEPVAGDERGVRGVGHAPSLRAGSAEPAQPKPRNRPPS